MAPLRFVFVALLVLGCSSEVTSTRGKISAQAVGGEIAEGTPAELREVASIFCTITSAKDTGTVRTTEYQDSAGRFCKRFIDERTTPAVPYKIRHQYDYAEKIALTYYFVNNISDGIIDYIIQYSETGAVKGRVDYVYDDAGKLAMKVHESASGEGFIPIAKEEFVNGAIKRAEYYTRGALTTYAVISENGLRRDAFSPSGAKVSTQTTRKVANNSDLVEPGIRDFLDNVVIMVDIDYYDAATGAQKSRVRQFRTISGGVRKSIEYDGADFKREKRATYYDPFTSKSFTYINYPGTMCTGYSVTYRYPALDLLRIRRQQINAGEVYSDLGRRSDYQGSWCQLTAAISELRDIQQKEIDLVAALPAERRKKVFAMFGDESTFERAPGYPVLPRDRIVLNLGTPGATSETVGQNFDLLPQSKLPVDAIFLNVGMNDLLAGNLAKQFPAPGSDFSQDPVLGNLASKIAVSVIDRVQQLQIVQPNAVIYLLALTPVAPGGALKNEHIAFVNAKIKERLDAVSKLHDLSKVFFKDLGPSFKNSQGAVVNTRLFQANGARLTLLGQGVMARQLFRLMMK